MERPVLVVDVRAMKQSILEYIKQILRNHQRCRYHLADRTSLERDCDHVALDAVNRALHFTPYYRDYPNTITDIAQVKEFPLLEKVDVILGPPEKFLSQKACKPLTIKRTTGGTSGISLDVFYQLHDILHYHQVANFAFGLIGKKLTVAQLRGNKPGRGKICQKVGPIFLLSSYQLNDQNLDTYIKVLTDHHISCLHVYPSSITILARLIKRRYGSLCLPDLKGIIASSEIFSREDKQLVKDAFGGVKLVDFYGLNELCCAAVAVDMEPFSFFQDYGYVEFVDTGQVTPSGNKIAQIVATSIMNKTMPLIRYATQDHVEIDPDGQVVAILGRTSDFLVNAHGQLTPCIFVNRDISFRHVVNFQYYQDTPGRLVFRVVTDGKFDAEDEQNLLTDLRQSFLDLETVVEVVDAVEKTKIGKQKRLIQLLDLSDYK